MTSSIRTGLFASSACGTEAGIRTIVPVVATTGWPPMVSASSPSSTIASASNGVVCSLNISPASNAKSVTLPPDVLDRMRLAMPFGVEAISSDSGKAVAGAMMRGLDTSGFCSAPEAAFENDGTSGAKTLGKGSVELAHRPFRIRLKAGRVEFVN